METGKFFTKLTIYLLALSAAGIFISEKIGQRLSSHIMGTSMHLGLPTSPDDYDMFQTDYNAGTKVRIMKDVNEGVEKAPRIFDTAKETHQIAYSVGGSIQLFDPSTRKIKDVMPASGAFKQAYFAGDTNLVIATESEDGQQLFTYDTVSEELEQQPLPEDLKHFFLIDEAKGDVALINTDNNSISVFSTEQGKVIFTTGAQEGRWGDLNPAEGFTQLRTTVLNDSGWHTYIWDYAEGKLIKDISLDLPGLSAGWSPDGTQVLDYGMNPEGPAFITAYSAVTGEVTMNIEVDGMLNYAQFSLDGKSILYAVEPQSGFSEDILMLYDIESGNRQAIGNIDGYRFGTILENNRLN